jgi:hypothetical protein
LGIGEVGLDARKVRPPEIRITSLDAIHFTGCQALLTFIGGEDAGQRIAICAA